MGTKYACHTTYSWLTRSPSLSPMQTVKSLAPPAGDISAHVSVPSFQEKTQSHDSVSVVKPTLSLLWHKFTI